MIKDVSLLEVQQHPRCNDIRTARPLVAVAKHGRIIWQNGKFFKVEVSLFVFVEGRRGRVSAERNFMLNYPTCWPWTDSQPFAQQEESVVDDSKFIQIQF